MIDIETEELQHTFGQKTDGVDRCPLCPGPHGGPGPCDHSKMSRRRLNFVVAHAEEFVAAHDNPDKRYGSAVKARLDREYATCPPGHICWCWCPGERCGLGQEECGRRRHLHQPCAECLRLRKNEKTQEPVEFGHTAAVHAAMPSAEMLDLAIMIARRAA